MDGKQSVPEYPFLFIARSAETSAGIRWVSGLFCVRWRADVCVLVEARPNVCSTNGSSAYIQRR